MTEASDGFTVHFPYLPGGLDDFFTKSCRNCSGAACSGANTKERRCGRISACRGRRTDFSKWRPRLNSCNS